MKKDNNTPTPSLIKEGNIIHLDRILFTEKIFNYREKENWEYLGDKPAIIDFWAEWCGPCQKISPIIEELAEEYKGKADFYKLTIDDEKEIADYFKIKSIPLLMYIPIDGKPFLILGVKNKAEIQQQIEKIL